MFMKKYFFHLGILLSCTLQPLIAQEQKKEQYPVRAVVLAAGKSTRFKTKKSKLLHPICGRPMILHILKTLDELNIPTTLVLGYQSADIQEAVNHSGIKPVTYAFQEKQIGTGNAVACAKHTWADAENIIMIYGDMPLVSKDIIEKIIKEHQAKKALHTFTTCTLQNPPPYGRVINTNGRYEIIESKDCTPEQLKITTVNAGIDMINQQWLFENIDKITPSKNSGEFYFTKIAKIASDQDKFVQTVEVPFGATQGANTLQEFAEVEHIKNTELIHDWMSKGVRFEVPSSTLIDMDVIIGADSIIKAGVQLRGKTTIGNGTTVDAYSVIQDTTIGDNCSIGAHAVINQVVVADNTTIAPLTYLHQK